MSDVMFTGRELDVMAVLWDQGSATVGEVRNKITDELAYTTVLTILRTLEMKGHVEHVDEGRAYRYKSTVDQRDARRNHLKRMTRKLFSGSTVKLLTHLLTDRSMREKDLLVLQGLVKEQLAKKKKTAASRKRR